VGWECKDWKNCLPFRLAARGLPTQDVPEAEKAMPSRWQCLTPVTHSWPPMASLGSRKRADKSPVRLVYTSYRIMACRLQITSTSTTPIGPRLAATPIGSEAKKPQTLARLPHRRYSRNTDGHRGSGQVPGGLRIPGFPRSANLAESDVWRNGCI